MLILASASPRRRQLLQGLGLSFDVRPQNCEEVSDAALPQDYVTQIALQKACSALKGAGEGDVVLAADTVVCLENTILGKPGTLAQARQMLEQLSSRTHKVCTGLVLMSHSRTLTHWEETAVTFYPLSREMIDWYLSTGEPMDKAGSYGIQGKGALLVQRVEGDFYNVVGLPLAPLARLFSEMGLPWAGEGGCGPLLGDPA